MRRRLRSPYFWLHALVALLGLFSCGVLVTSRGGHPPGIVLLPAAAAAWLVLHGFLFLVQKLAERGAQRVRAGTGATAQWPPALIVFVFASSVASLVLPLGLAARLLSNASWSAYQLGVLSVQAVAFACLCGVLLRRDWARVVAGGLCVLLSLWYAFRVGSAVLAGRDLAWLEVLWVLLPTAALGAFGVHLLRSARVRAFFA